MGIEGQQPFEATPLGQFAAKVATEEKQPAVAKERLETDDGFRVTLDRQADKRGTVAQLESNGGRTEFLIINGQLYNPVVIREGTIDESTSKKFDTQLINTHGRRLTALINQGLIH